MKIHADGGALCAPLSSQYGNFGYSRDLFSAISQYDKKNSYTIYTFCDSPFIPSSETLHFKKLTPAVGFMPYRVGLEEARSSADVFLAINQAIPLFTKGKIIAVSHGLAFHYYPQLYKEAISMLNNQLQGMLRRTDCIIVSSEKVKQELNKIAPHFKNIVVIPFGVSPRILNTKFNDARENFLLYVGMDHPIKQIELLIKRFLSAKKKVEDTHWKLLLVGVSKHYESINPSISVLEHADHDELINLYQSVSGLVTASLYESFNIPVLEALSCGTPVVGLKTAIIPELSRYVSVAKDEDEFEELMAQLMKNELSVKTKINKDEFQWEEYVKKLVSLY